jgi:hypothetical protein
VKLSAAVDLFVADRRSQGRINSPNTEAAYRAKLDAHAEDVSERDPSKTGRDDVKRTLRRWEHPNSQRQEHAVLTSLACSPGCAARRCACCAASTSPAPASST